MPLFAECCVIIPCSTIEDFPARLDPAGARSLLGGLTAVWHPRLIAGSRRTPTWHRSDDTPPAISANSDAEDAGTSNTSPVRLLIVPEVCVSTLPSELRESVDNDAISHHTALEDESREIRVRVSSREDALEKIAAAVAMVSDDSEKDCWPDSTDSNSLICEKDFFALGYTWWQTQVLTRRLRYTSNLDHLHFENRLVAAATHFVSGELHEATEALHDCFDALAEERDHYFSSDPALIDLTLLTPGTLDSWLQSRVSTQYGSSPASGSVEPRTILPTPQNILVDESVAQSIISGDADRRNRFRACLSRSENEHDDHQAAEGADQPNDAATDEQKDTSLDPVGWIGGGPASDFSFDEHSIAASEQRIADAVRTVREAGVVPLSVYARLGGGIAAEWVPAIAAAGFDGIVPIDFLNGRGFDEESKVLLGEGEQEVEALTAKPIDADDESSFLTLSTRLGEAIDRGEIATALMVHWPGGGCDSFHDVRRAASWSLCLGRFWRLDEYFVDGERPYHHGSSPKATPSAAETIADVARRRSRLQEDLRTQAERNLRGFAALVDPSCVLNQSDASSPPNGLQQRIVSALGFESDAAASGSSAAAENMLLLHPAHPAARTSVHVAGNVSPNAGSVFHANSSGNGTDLIVDVPAWGYAVVGAAVKRQASDDAGKSTSTLQKLTRWFTGGSRRIITENRLSNEFMEVSINPEHGGIEGVYSGPGRGNRFSTRILLAPSAKVNAEKGADAAACQWETNCESMQTLHDSRGSAVIELTGTFSPHADSTGSAETLAGASPPQRWQSQYRLDRGSRRLLYRVRFTPVADDSMSIVEAWKSSPVLRVATADATPIVRAILREKLVRTSARSFQSSLGYVIDEEERTTLVASESSTIHRRSGERFVDSLMSCAKTEHPDEAWGNTTSRASDNTQWSDWQSFAFGFDVRHAVASAKSFATGDRVPALPIVAKNGSVGNAPSRGWLIHPSPISLEVQVVDVGRVVGEANGDSPGGEFMALHLRVIQTASRPAAASLRFCRDVDSVYEVSSLSRPFRNDAGTVSLTRSRLSEISNPDSIQHNDDRVRWSQPSHGVVHMIVLFPNGGQT
ncbi:hypothetical protein [Aporhodopirellula aestuarii]|uniref:Uncharacterized protein n=1 Tax=Aporhodopirellula aestuarii TaxID=2950107 RepID=A0ABT0TZP1_9BACT|nr:hypothetical protein [Aporhodopirellula aestuarii]MCM2370082.1 hypothetical protein [Aporhodopirellula aestuarii]